MKLVIEKFLCTVYHFKMLKKQTKRFPLKNVNKETSEFVIHYLYTISYRIDLNLVFYSVIPAQFGRKVFRYTVTSQVT